MRTAFCLITNDTGHILNNYYVSGFSSVNFSYVEALNSHNPLGEDLFIHSFIYLILFLKAWSPISPAGLKLTV